MKRIYTGLLVLAFTISANAQVSISLGTDIPYQFYTGVTLEKSKVDFSIRTGILVSPYSDAIIDILEMLNVDDPYISLLNSAYDFGWMNSMGAYYKFGENQQWYVGSEFRIDHLTASDAPIDILEDLTGQSIRDGIRRNEAEAQLGLTLVGLGLRLGRNIPLGDKDNQFLKLEFSVAKYISTQSSLEINEQSADNINRILDELLWEDVFKPSGYVGGLGVSYTVKF